MLMWHSRDFARFIVETNDIRHDIKADYHYSSESLYIYLNADYYDILIFDPPYINLNKRTDTKKYEKAFDYNAMKSLADLKRLVTQSSYVFNYLLKENGILIVKITNFHLNGRIHGHIDMINWFSQYFYLFDEIIYRFFKPIPNLNFYNKKVAKVHTYFLIFKNHGKKEESNKKK